MPLTSVILTALIAQAPEAEPRRPLLVDYVDELCVDAPDDACRVLRALAEALDLTMRPDAIDAGSWCCKTCSAEGTTAKCEGCVQGGKMMKCGGGITGKFADRPVHLDCPGKTIEAGEAVTCL